MEGELDEWSGVGDQGETQGEHCEQRWEGKGLCKGEKREKLEQIEMGTVLEH